MPDAPSNQLGKYDAISIAAYADIRASIRDADILLFEGQSVLDQMIQKGTGSTFSHCAMTFWWHGRLMVTEAIIDYGVHTLPLSRYLADYQGTILLCRHSEVSDRAGAILDSATDFLGDRYNTDEILDITARIAMGLGPTYQRTDALICSEYIARCFDAAGIAISPNPSSYWFPSTIAADARLTPLWELKP